MKAATYDYEESYLSYAAFVTALYIRLLIAL